MYNQGETTEELNISLKEVLDILLGKGEPDFDAEPIGTQPFAGGIGMTVDELIAHQCKDAQRA